MKNDFYNGWKSVTFVNSAFVFVPDGVIKMCILNCPGNWHNSQIAEYKIYKKMQYIYDLYNAQIVVDLAFQVLKTNLIKSLQQDPELYKCVSINRAATSVRQPSEWVMSQIQGQFPWLKDCLP